MSRDIVVIGGGISGLTAAHELVRRGHRVTVLERQAETGGNAISERFGGFLMEHGPSTMNAMMPEAQRFVGELNLDATQIGLGEGVRRRYLLDGAKLHGIRANPFGFLLSDYLSVPGRLAMVSEILKPRVLETGDESIHAFASRRFGREFADKVMDPLAAGLFCGDARQLSVRAVFPKLVEFEQRYGSVTRAVIASRRGSQPGKRLYSWPNGIAALPSCLAGRLAEKIHTSVAVKRIKRDAAGFVVQTSRGLVRASVVVLAVQPHVAASLLEDVEPETASALAQISAPPLAVAFLGYRREQVAHPLDGLGFLATKSANGLINGAQFCSTMFQGRAPEDHISIAAYVGGTRNPDAAQLPKYELLAGIEAELSGLMGIIGRPAVTRLRHWPLGLPQYTTGHLKRVTAVKTTHQRLPGLYLTGNYLDGVSVANCIKAACCVAEHIDSQMHLVETSQTASIRPKFRAISRYAG